MSTEPARAIPSDEDPAGTAQDQKRELRARIRAARGERSAAQRAADDAARIDHLAAWLRGLGARRVAAYISTGTEPSLAALLDELHAQHVAVLLPILGRRDDGQPRREPDWGWYGGPDSLREGIWGIAEPSGPALGMAALEEADVILLPGLAVDPAGRRLGQGGAWYDRALAYADPAAPLCVTLNADEVIPAVPTEAHDRRVRYVATPDGVRELGL